MFSHTQETVIYVYSAMGNCTKITAESLPRVMCCKLRRIVCCVVLRCVEGAVVW